MEYEIAYLITWWSLLLAIGIVSIPVLSFCFRKFTDLGYGFSKVIGSLVVTYIIFILATSQIAGFSKNNLYLISVCYLLLNIFLYYRNKKRIHRQLKSKIKTIIFQEILFTLGFAYWSYVRAHQPDINGLEKFMDFGFINSILRSKYLPPPDMWFAGKPINYYWFGHLWVAVLTKLSNIPSTITYNLMIATILGFTLTSAFSITSTLAKSIKPKVNKKTIFLAGLISAILLTFAGNFHTPFYVLKEGKEEYWYPDATRFIGYNPETEDKTIHEFPIYSFIVSDLHAHLINLPFVLLFIAFLLRAFSSKKKVKLMSVLPLGFLLGVFFITSTWDIGNYFVLFCVTSLIFILNYKKLSLSTFLKTGMLTLVMLVVSLLTAFPFIANFESIAKGVEFVHSHSPLWQLAILWGFPTLLTTIFIVTIRKKWKKLTPSDSFVLALLITCWLLIILPEIIFVKDIYIASHYRANTMFKLTYQAFVVSYLSSGYVVIKVLSSIKNRWLKVGLALLFAAVFSSILSFPRFGIESFYNDLKEYKGLSGDTWIEKRHPEIYNAISWFKNNVNNQPVILEAPGDSYTEFNIISAYTGLPTVSGWFVHEWLWRGDSSFPQKRVSDITQIYTTEDVDLAKTLLKKFNVEYVIIGHNERQKFPNINEEKFESLGKVVFTSGNTTVYQLH